MRWLNKKSACKYAGVSNNTFQRWIDDGLKVSRIGNVIRINTDEIDAYLNSFSSSANEALVEKLIKVLGGRS